MQIIRCGLLLQCTRSMVCGCVSLMKTVYTKTAEAVDLPDVGYGLGWAKRTTSYVRPL